MENKIELGRVPKEPTWIPDAYGDWVPEGPSWVPESKARKSWGTNLPEPKKQWKGGNK